MLFKTQKDQLKSYKRNRKKKRGTRVEYISCDRSGNRRGGFPAHALNHLPENTYILSGAGTGLSSCLGFILSPGSSSSLAGSQSLTVSLTSPLLPPGSYQGEKCACNPIKPMGTLKTTLPVTPLRENISSWLVEILLHGHRWSLNFQYPCLKRGATALM